MKSRTIEYNLEKTPIKRFSTISNLTETERNVSFFFRQRGTFAVSVQEIFLLHIVALCEALQQRDPARISLMMRAMFFRVREASSRQLCESSLLCHSSAFVRYGEQSQACSA